jgi:hypothetical protein
MRMSQLAQWVAGGVAGCPGTVDVTTLDDSPTPTAAPQGRGVSVANPPTKQRARRSRWLTVAAVILVAEGGLGILYLPVLTGSSIWPFHPVAIPIVGLSVLNIGAADTAATKAMEGRRPDRSFTGDQRSTDRSAVPAVYAARAGPARSKLTPRSRRLTQVSCPMTTWSSTSTSSRRPAAIASAVRWRSSGEGVGSPDG